MNVKTIAHVCHEANRALQTEQADETIPVSPSWKFLDEETRQSAIQGYDELPASQQTKDHLFAAIVNALKESV